MSEVVGEFARTLAAFDQPTLSLLHQRQAPSITAVLSTSFSSTTRTILASHLHLEVEEHVSMLASSGLSGELPKGTGREMCQTWCKAQWLIHHSDDGGGEVYSLTSHAQQALDFIKHLRQDRTGLSEHRISNIVSTARRLSRDSNVDPAERIEMLDSEILELKIQRDKLMNGGEITTISDDRLLEGFIELLNLVSQLPADFVRVEEAFRAVRQEILQDFRDERRVAGEVLDLYLDRIDNLMTATAEGRAFEGAFALLRDDDLLDQLRTDLVTLIQRNEDVLSVSDKEDLLQIVPQMRNGLSAVLDQRTRVSTMLKNYIVRRDSIEDRELDYVLRTLEATTVKWLAVAGVREHVEVELLPERVQMEYLTQRFFEGDADDVPDRLEATEPDDDAQGLSVEELRQTGGPQMNELLARLEVAIEDGSFTTMGGFFRELDTEHQRPVDVLGLLQLAVDEPELIDAPDGEAIVTRRPDGTERRLQMPLITRGGDSGPTEPVHEEARNLA